MTDKRLVALGLLLIFIASLLYYFKGFFVVALVNYRPITRYWLDRELEKRGGNDVLETQIAETLILQEAGAKNIKPTLGEIDERFQEIDNQLKDQGRDGLEAALATQNISLKDFRRQLMIQLVVEKLLKDRVQVKEEDIKTYFDNNKSSYPKGVTLESKSEEIRKILNRQKLAQEVPLLIEELKQKAKIYRFVNF